MIMNLTTWQRLFIVQLISNLRGVPLGVIKDSLSAIEKIQLSEAEIETVNFSVKEGRSTWEQPNHEWELEVSETTAKLVESVLENHINAKDGWDVTTEDLLLIELCENLGIDMEEGEE